MKPNEGARNVVLVVADSARADAFGQGCPILDELGDKGLRFTRAIAPGGWTLPSHVSLFSGLSPTEHDAVAQGRGKLEDRRHALARVSELAKRQALLPLQLQSAGVRTFSSSPNPWVSAATGLDAGFDEHHFFGFLSTDGQPRARPLPSSRPRQILEVFHSMAQHARWIRSERDKGARKVLTQMEALFKSKSRPFFAFTNIIEMHEPHFPPPTQRPPGLDVRTSLDAIHTVLQPPLIRLRRVRAHNYGKQRLPDSVVERWRHAYRAEAAYVDGWLGDLVESLERARVADDTVVIFTGDHGENFGEDRVIGHGLSVHNALANVPLLIWGAGVRQETVGTAVSLNQIAATIRDLALGTDEQASLLVPDAWGQARFEIEDPHRVSIPPARAKRRSRGPGAAFYDGEKKLVVHPFDGTPLYDLDRDPQELNDVSDQIGPTDSQSRQLTDWKERVAKNRW